MIEALVSWGFVAGIALAAKGLGHIQDKKERERKRREAEEWRRRQTKYEKERRKREQEEEKRRTSPLSYSDGVSKEEFETIVNDVVGKMPRIRSLKIDGLVVRIGVTSNSGLSDWEATIDFNDYGHLTGWYRILTDNDQSPIPQTIANRVCEALVACRTSHEQNDIHI